MPKQQPKESEQPVAPIEVAPELAPMIVEDAKKPTKPKEAKPVNTTRLPSGIVIEDY